MSTAADIPLLVVSENSSSERRVTPSWSIAVLKARLEPITGVPATCQRLSLKVGSQPPHAIEAQDEDKTQIGTWPLQPYAELQVGGSEPTTSRLLLSNAPPIPEQRDSSPAAPQCHDLDVSSIQQHIADMTSIVHVSEDMAKDMPSSRDTMAKLRSTNVQSFQRLPR